MKTTENGTPIPGWICLQLYDLGFFAFEVIDIMHVFNGDPEAYGWIGAVDPTVPLHSNYIADACQIKPTRSEAIAHVQGIYQKQLEETQAKLEQLDALAKLEG